MPALLPGLAVLLLLLAGVAPGAEPAAEAAKPKRPVIMLKLDDLTRITPKWQRVADFLDGEGLRCTMGMIGDGLEKEDPATTAWVKEHAAKGTIEFWNHGYIGRFAKDEVKKGEFVGTGYEAQLKDLKRTQELARQRFGLDFIAFGPHDSATDADTYKALDAIPEIRIVWFYGPKAPATTTKVIIERRIELEKPIFKPNFAAFQERFEKGGKDRDYLAMQGHANSWDDAGFAEFQQVVRFLKAQGCSFVTASEWLASRK